MQIRNKSNPDFAENATESARVALPVEGMTCASCVRNVEKAITNLDGVREANVNLALENVTLDYDPRRISLAKIADAVEAAGYKLHIPISSSEPEAHPSHRAGARLEETTS